MANVKTGIVKTNGNGVAKAGGLKGLLMSMQGQIAKALPTVLTPERYTRMVMTALSTNPQLQQCTPESFLGAVMQAAQLGVEPNTPLGSELLGVMRFGWTSHEPRSEKGRDGVIFEFYKPKLKFKPSLVNRGPVVAYYAMFRTKDGGFNFAVMSREDVEQFAKQYSKAAGSGYSPWSTNFDSMAKKTVLKQVLKYAPLKSDFVREIATDSTIKTNIQPNMADLEDETVIDVTPAEDTPPEVPFDGPTQDEIPFGKD